MKYKYIIIFLLCILFSSLFSIYFMQCPCWDFLAYHYHNGWAFVNNRLDTDFLASFHRTYYNPIMDAINFLLINKLNNYPLLFNIVLHLKYGIFLFLCYLFYDYIFVSQKDIKNVSILFCILLTILSPIIYVCLTLYYIDIEQANLALISLYIIVRTIYSQQIQRKTILFLFAGLLLGISIGLKYSMFSFFLAVLLAIIFQFKQVSNWLKVSLTYISGIVIGTVFSSGWWMYILYKKFENPIFPFFNNIFGSNYADKTAVLDFDYGYLHPDNLFSFLTLPIKSTFAQLNGFELIYYDIKTPLCFISIIILLFLLISNKAIKEKISEIIDYNTFKFLLLFFISYYYINLYVFGQYRYILILFVLSSVIITVACFLLSFKRKIYNYIFILSIVGIIAYHFLYDYQYNSIFPESFSIYYIYSSEIAIILLLILCILIYRFKDSKKIFFLLLCGIFICNICTFVTDDTFIHFPNPFENHHIIKISDMSIPDNSIVLLGTMKTAFIVPGQNKNAKYYGYVLPDNIAEQTFWATDLYRNKLYKNKYWEGKIKEILLSDKRTFIIFNLEQILDDFELYKESVRQYSDNIKDIDDCKMVEYEVYGHINMPDEYIICEIK